MPATTIESVAIKTTKRPPWVLSAIKELGAISIRQAGALPIVVQTSYKEYPGDEFLTDKIPVWREGRPDQAINAAIDKAGGFCSEGIIKSDNFGLLSVSKDGKVQATQDKTVPMNLAQYIYVFNMWHYHDPGKTSFQTKSCDFRSTRYGAIFPGQKIEDITDIFYKTSVPDGLFLAGQKFCEGKRINLQEGVKAIRKEADTNTLGNINQNLNQGKIVAISFDPGKLPKDGLFAKFFSAISMGYLLV